MRVIIPEIDVSKYVYHSANNAFNFLFFRYLDRYEKIHFLGETLDRNVDDDEDSRHKRFSARNNHNQHQPVVPHQYNYHQHIVPGNFDLSVILFSNVIKYELVYITRLRCIDRLKRFCGQQWTGVYEGQNIT